MSELCTGLKSVGHVFPPYFIPPETKINAARRRFAVLTLSANRTGLHLTQIVPLVLCLVRRSVKLGVATSLARFVATRPRLVGFVEVSCRPEEPNERHDATRSHHQDPREDHG